MRTERVREGILEEAIFNLGSEDKEEFSRRVGGRRGKKELGQGEGSSSATAQGAVVLDFVGAQSPVSCSPRNKNQGWELHQQIQNKKYVRRMIQTKLSGSIGRRSAYFQL